jgi:predicted nucleic acid-binding protein
MREVARLKAENSIALADCFAVALAAEEGAVLLTGDPEIIDRAKELPCEVEDLRG